MIKYQLQCDKDHQFEGWFQSGDAFDTQKKRGFVECPVCQSNKVDRAIMAPSVARTDKEIVASLPVAQEPNWVSAGSEEILMSPEMIELRERMAELRDEMIKNADDVGTDFAEEARRIHYGETEKRQIYGHTSLDEVQELIEEGISVLPLPPGRDVGH
ncbi:MAG: DUF1178 family protein [Beijerinckiaceae bacterium]|nr:DUF1178 family protein [Beijerinckiaceae bacterium]